MKRLGHTLPKADLDRVIAAHDCTFPKVLPSRWQIAETNINGQWLRSEHGIGVCYEVEFIDDDLWIHISLSRRDRVPNYDDLAEVKGVFLGPHRKAIMVLPIESEHFNLHPFCLHLYSPITRDPLPDFRTEDHQL